MSFTLPGDFANRDRAWEHLCDHVLTRPEAHDWALLLPDYRETVDPADDDGLRRLAASFYTPEGARCEADGLLAKYVEAMVQAAADALQLGWWWVEKSKGLPVHQGLGLDGIFVVWDRKVLRSGMLHRSVRYPPSGTINRQVDPLPRRRATRNPGQPPPCTLDSRFRLFRDNLARVSKKYAKAYSPRMSAGPGARVFVDELPRLEQWQQWLGQRAQRTEIIPENRS